MRKKVLSRDNVRALLREHEEGLTTAQIAQQLGISDEIKAQISRVLHAMPDAYIDRWEGPRKGQYSAVWCVVVPPDHCPHPRGRVVAVRKSGRKAAGENPPAAKN